MTIVVRYQDKYNIKHCYEKQINLSDTCHHCKKTFRFGRKKRHIRQHCEVARQHRKNIGFPVNMTYVKQAQLKQLRKWCSIHFISQLYKHVGIHALSNIWLCSNGFKTNYHRVVGGFQVKLEDLAEKWGVHNEWKRQRKENMNKGHGCTNWTEKYFDNISNTLIKEHGLIPPASWLRANGYGSYLSFAYSKGWNVQVLQERYNFITHNTSRAGIRWRSHPEVCVSNFLYSRGIKHCVGKRYPLQYNVQSGFQSGTYDLHFFGITNEYAQKEINVEIWGNNPDGSGPKGRGEMYRQRRSAKEQYHKDDPLFLAINWKDCLNEDRLIDIFKPYIGMIKPYIFRDECDSRVKPTNWSKMDLVKEQCKKIMKHNNDKLPGEGWMRRRGKYKNRDTKDWELNDKSLINLNSLRHYITDVGGFRFVRNFLHAKRYKYSHSV